MSLTALVTKHALWSTTLPHPMHNLTCHHASVFSNRKITFDHMLLGAEFASTKTVKLIVKNSNQAKTLTIIWKNVICLFKSPGKLYIVDHKLCVLIIWIQVTIFLSPSLCLCLSVSLSVTVSGTRVWVLRLLWACGGKQGQWMNESQSALFPLLVLKISLLSVNFCLHPCCF